MAWTAPLAWNSGRLVSVEDMNKYVSANDSWLYGENHGTSAGQQVMPLGANGLGGDYNAPALAIHSGQTGTGWWRNTYGGQTHALSWSVNGTETFTIADDGSMVQYRTFEVRPGTVTGYPTPVLPGLLFQVQSAGTFIGYPGNNVLTLNRTVNDGGILAFQQDGTVEGFVSVSGNTLTYQTFLGAHFTQLADGQTEPPLYGVVIATGAMCPSDNTYWEEDVLGTHNDGSTWVKETKRHYREGPGWRKVEGDTRDTIPRVGMTDIAGDVRVYGVWYGKTAENGEGMSFGLYDRPVYSVGGLGLGQIRVTDTNGDIANGDYLQTSARPFEAECQNSTTLNSSTVAKALEAVTWDDEPVDGQVGYKWKLIAATLHCG